MHAFVVLGLVFSIPSQEIGLEICLGMDLFCVQCDVEPQLDRSLNLGSAYHLSRLLDSLLVSECLLSTADDNESTDHGAHDH